MTPAVFAATCFSVVFYALLPVIAKKLQLGDLPALALMAMTQLLLACLACTALFLTQPEFRFTTIDKKTWSYIAGFASINFVGFWLYLYAVARAPVTEYQLVGMLTPVFGACFAYLLLSEPFKPRYAAGLALIILGLFVALKEWKIPDL